MDSVTIKDIAKICGVGVSTVSRAMNNHPDINPETKEKILEAIRRYHYVPNNSARNLKRSDARTIAVLVKGIGNPFFSGMLKVFEKEIHKEKYSLVIQHVDDREDEVEVAIQLEKEKRLRGIVFLGGFFSHSEDKLKKISVPFILCTIGLLGDTKKKKYASVCVDDVKESMKIVEYLIEKGHRKIAILGSAQDDESIGKLRLDGYLRALSKHGIPVQESLIKYMKEDFGTYTMENGYAMTKELLAEQADFTALFAIADRMAVGACKAIFDSGKSVPEDYSVVGFDGLDLAQFYNPSITTLRQPTEKMAEAAIQMLFAMIRKKSISKRIVFEGELTEAQSVREIL